MIASLIFNPMVLSSTTMLKREGLIILLVELENHFVEYWTKMEEFD